MEEGGLLSLGSHFKQGGDEEHVASDVAFLHTLYLPLSPQLHRFVSLEGAPRRFKREEAQPWFDQGLDEPMIWFEEGVEILDLPQGTPRWNSVRYFEFLQCFGIGRIFVDRDDVRSRGGEARRALKKNVWLPLQRGSHSRGTRGPRLRSPPSERATSRPL